MTCVNFRHAPTKLICLLINRCPMIYEGDSSTFGTECIVLHEVFLNFLMKCITYLFITEYGINTSIEPC